MFELKSIENNEVIKTMTSSGTSGQAVSRIFLDRETSSNQTKVLSKIVSSFTGKKRMPMIIIDSDSVVKNRKLFSARGAGILGFSMFGSKRIYALNDKMELKIDSIIEFIEQNKDETTFIFGFTYMIYLHFYKELERLNIKLDLSNSVMIHGGGWKKLINESVSSNIFKKKLKNVCYIESVHDYYGMVEQTGSIYIECEKGHLHASIFSDIIIRNPKDFSIAKVGEKGIIQVLSILPNSYPGHSLLTEDEGILLGEDNCSCGRLGKYFKIVGRLKNAEIRGCSDTYAQEI
jgi:phenylacetate-coenzyme A ligase PaaK-like adenylate-forming protein